MAIVGLMLTLWLAVVVLSTSPALHQWMHPDSQGGSHECLVTHFIKSQVLSDASTGIVPATELICVANSRSPDQTLVSQPEYRLFPSRAPPALFSSLKG
jgi:hypothetical protein